MSVARNCLLLEISIRLASRLDAELIHLRALMGHSAAAGRGIGVNQHVPVKPGLPSENDKAHCHHASR